MNNRATQFLQVGDPVPELTLPALDGGVVSLRNFLGRKLILFMWASW